MTTGWHVVMNYLLRLIQGRQLAITLFWWARYPVDMVSNGSKGCHNLSTLHKAKWSVDKGYQAVSYQWTCWLHMSNFFKFKMGQWNWTTFFSEYNTSLSHWLTCILFKTMQSRLTTCHLFKTCGQHQMTCHLFKTIWSRQMMCLSFKTSQGRQTTCLLHNKCCS